jgi:spore germination protein
MIIHTVQPDETVYSIAELYGISADNLIRDNQIINPDRMIVGESLAVMFPMITYVIREGDSLESIAASYGVSVMELLRSNPQLSDRLYIYPGEEITIRFTDEKRMELSINGYAFPFIKTDVLRKTLPYLTYLTIFYYRITNEGDIVNIEDQELIDIAKVYGVAPLMCISTISEIGEADVETAHSILTNKDKQENLIDRVLENMNAKGYYGLNIDMQNILQEDRELYVDFIASISSRVRQEGYYVNITLTPRTFPTGTNFMYLGPEYATLGQLTDGTMLLSYEWGHSHSPQPALPIVQVRALLDYSITQIPAEKISIGLPTIGYIWQLPFVPEYTIANAITHDSALALANEVGATVQRDAASEAPYFTYAIDTEYIVWFRDVRSTAALLELVEEYGLEGIGVWNIMQFASGPWLMINARYDIRKIE